MDELEATKTDTSRELSENSSGRHDRRWKEAIFIGLLALTLNLAGNSRIQPWDRDEPRYAGCAREMLRSGDWLHPTFNGEPRYHKPILIYWLMLAGMAIGGDNPFGARLVSVVAGTASCLLVWALGRRLFGPRVGFWSALILATAPIVVVESKLATTDATLLLLLLGCQFAVWELSRRDSPLAVGAFWICLALATLTKGPVGLGIIAAAGVACWWFYGPTAAWRRLLGPLVPDRSGLATASRLREGFHQGLAWGTVRGVETLARSTGMVLGRWVRRNWGFLTFVLLTAPWFIAIGIMSQGDFFRVAMGKHVVHRMVTGMESHGGFPGYYVLLTLPLFYPWSALLPVGIVAAWARRKRDPAFGFLLGWIVGPLILLELVRTKLIHYYLPAYPACALLGAWVILEVARSEVSLRRWPLGRLSFGLLVGVGLALTVICLAGGIALPGGLRWPALVAALVLGVGTLYSVERVQAGAIERGAAGLAACWAMFLLIGGAWFLPAADPYRLTLNVAERLAELEAAEDVDPIIGHYKPPGIIYELGHPVPELHSEPELFALTQRLGRVVVALNEDELKRLHESPRLELEDRGSVSGFDVERFRYKTLRMTLIRGVETRSTSDAVASSTFEKSKVQ